MFFKLSLLGLFFLAGCAREEKAHHSCEREAPKAYPFLNDVPEKPEEPLWEAYEKDTNPTHHSKEGRPISK